MSEPEREEFETVDSSYFVHRLPANLIATAAALAVAITLVDAEALTGAALGLSAKTWWYIVLALPIAHQLYVWAFWRGELCWRALGRRYGAEEGFAWFRRLFFMFLLARPLVALGLALADRGTLVEPGLATYLLGALLFVPAAWTMYSVEKYFGPYRAAGADHFIARYRTMPFERRGAFRYVPNAMYTLGFLLFWAIAIALASRAALVAAGYVHVVIWIHYLTLERPDMEVIYGEGLARYRRGERA